MIQEYLQQLCSYYHPKPEVKFVGMPGLILYYGKSFVKISQNSCFMGNKKECFKNAYQLSFTKNLTYCEGYAVSKILNFPVEHAWCIDNDNNVIDPTWNDGIEYFGIPFSMEFIINQALKTSVYGVFGNGRCKQWVNNGFKETELKNF